MPLRKVRKARTYFPNFFKEKKQQKHKDLYARVRINIGVLKYLYQSIITIVLPILNRIL